MKRWLISILLAGTTVSTAFARVGETEKEVEARYGSPLPKDHPALTQKEIARLLEMPLESGVCAAVDLYIAKLKLQTSPYREKAMQILGMNSSGSPKSTPTPDTVAKLTNDYAKTVAAFEPRLYIFQGILIQVVYLHLNEGVFSISEQYFDLIDNNTPSTSPEKGDVLPSNKLQEWFKLGDFSYRITSAKISKSVVGPNDLANQIASSVQDMVSLEFNEQAKATGLDLRSSDSGERFVIIDYDIRNDASSPSVVLTDDFRLEDGEKRQFTPDSEVTKTLIVTSDKALIAEVLQPGIERHCFQGFRVPAKAVSGALTLIVPEKGVLGRNSARVTVREFTSHDYSLRAIEFNLLRSVMAKTLEMKELPSGLKTIAQEADSKYYDYMNGRWDTSYNSKLPLYLQSNGQISRIFLNFTGRDRAAKEDSTGWKMDPLYQIHEIGYLTASQAAKRIKEALKQAEAETAKTKGF